jgi:hypothetical protein
MNEFMIEPYKVNQPIDESKLIVKRILFMANSTKIEPVKNGWIMQQLNLLHKLIIAYVLLVFG